MLVKDEEAIFGYSDHAVVVELQTDKATDELIVAFVVHNTFKDLVDTDLRIFCDHSEVVIVPPWMRSDASILSDAIFDRLHHLVILSH